MFFYSRKISFIDYYINGVKSGNVGVVRQRVSSEGIHLAVEIFGLEQWDNFCCQIYLGSPEGKRNIFRMDIVNGRGKSEVLLSFDEIKIQGNGKIFFRFGNDCYGVTELCEVPKQELPVMESDSANEFVEAKLLELSETEEDLLEECVLPREDKWESIKKKYPILYPFKGQGPYVSIKPVDLQLLNGRYHCLGENSFLMHAYYQYKHLILGEYSMDGSTFFYVGAPGEFVKKEQTAAAMFGFAGYEYSGDLGYYLYRVEL